MSTNIFLIKHGESAISNLKAESPVPSEAQNLLTENGENQIKMLSLLFKKELKSAVIWSSPSSRVIQSAKITSEVFKSEIQVSDMISDRLQNIEGVNLKKYRDMQELVGNNPFFVPDGGESFIEHRQRVQSWFSSFIVNLDFKENYFIFSHGATIEHINSFLLGQSVFASRYSYAVCYPGRFHHWVAERGDLHNLSFELRSSNSFEILPDLANIALVSDTGSKNINIESNMISEEEAASIQKKLDVFKSSAFEKGGDSLESGGSASYHR